MISTLHTGLSPTLVREGIAREVVRGIANLRKDRKLRVEDRIRVRWYAEGEAREAMLAWADWIQGEVLGTQFVEADASDGLDAQFVDVGKPFVGIEFAASGPEGLGAQAAGEHADRVGAIECPHREAVSIGPDEGEWGKY